jgi:hypothetical protein
VTPVSSHHPLHDVPSIEIVDSSGSGKYQV